MTRNSPLTPTVFYILLALSLKERHGYDIMKQVISDSQGKISMGPGTLYGSIKRMLEENLIEETDIKIDNQLDDQRRRYYRLTEQGRTVLAAELNRFDDIVQLARQRHLLPGATI